MHEITTKNKACFSPVGLTFYNNQRPSSPFSGSSSFEVFSSTPTPKISTTPKKRLVPIKKTKSEGYRVNKSLVISKATVFSALPTSRKFLAFYSISFPLGLSDQLAMKCLNIWLTRVRVLSPKINYLWVAERQKNKTIHFHLLCDKFLNIRVVNFYMAKALDGIRNECPAVFRDWNRAKYNGVDVKRVFNTKGITKYLTKYIAKGESVFNCRANGFSRLVSALFTKLLTTSYLAFGYWNYFSYVEDTDPFSKRQVLNDFAVWLPWRFGLPPDIAKKLLHINLQVVSILN